MSKESVKKFLEKVREDEGFANQVAECKDDEERLSLSKASGFDFTMEELSETLSEEELSDVELSDDDLDNVAGGGRSGGGRRGGGEAKFQRWFNDNIWNTR